MVFQDPPVRFHVDWREGTLNNRPRLKHDPPSCLAFPVNPGRNPKLPPTLDLQCRLQCQTVDIKTRKDDKAFAKEQSWQTDIVLCSCAQSGKQIYIFICAYACVNMYLYIIYNTYLRWCMSKPRSASRTVLSKYEHETNRQEGAISATYTAVGQNAGTPGKHQNRWRMDVYQAQSGAIGYAPWPYDTSFRAFEDGCIAGQIQLKGRPCIPLFGMEKNRSDMKRAPDMGDRNLARCNKRVGRRLNDVGSSA